METQHNWQDELIETKAALSRQIGPRQTAYRALFDGPNGNAVLADLARFCHYRATTAVVLPDGTVDAHGTSQLEGRRQVFLRIMEALFMEDSDLERMARDYLAAEENR